MRGNRRSNKRNEGGNVLPSEYFGRDSGNYHSVGSSALTPCPRQFAEVMELYIKMVHTLVLFYIQNNKFLYF